jgi:hypothetical protein
MTVVGLHGLWPADTVSFGMVLRDSMSSTGYRTTRFLRKAWID